MMEELTELKYHYPFPLLHPSLPHKTIEAGELGGRRVFVVGDIHGCLDEFKQLLSKANVTPSDTLVVCCGDLVRKGPKSQETLDYFESLGSQAVVSVRGNHDESMMFRTLVSSVENDSGVSNINYLHELPYTISIPSLNIIIVHAGLVPGVPLNRQHPIDMTTMRGVVQTSDGYAGTQSKFVGPWAAMWPGPEHVYFGHNASRGLQEHAFATGLDTGCVYGRQLTGALLSPDGSQPVFYKVDAQMVYEVPDI